ncbi:46 kDa FK506-binding nuclear protein-like [Pectinophora gossypiella]|uniref:46 kDa FK506-binding nuclear protein-like n=1 Tax=Pectinophora gossypiella TaxID=13191 RepID=UPI00214ECDEC|nr:46 kDa FK506-binding nuclear protein-like [Pectinophora gossypiella]
MFWGLIMEPNKRYTQVVEKPFHISQAAMDISTGDNDPCQVMVVVDGKNFLVCTLQKQKCVQVPLDLYFKSGNSISFLTNGKCNIHLTGYLDPEFEEETSDLEEEEEDEEMPALVPAKGKRKLENSNDVSAKKPKKDKKAVAAADSSDEDSDEEDQLQKLLDGDDVDTDENDESFKVNTSGEVDSDDDDEDEDDDEEEEAEAEEDSSEEEAETTVDTSKEELDLSKLSKNARRRLKKRLAKEGKEVPQVNGVDKGKKEKQQDGQQQKAEKKKQEKKEAKEEAGDKKEKKSLSGGVFIEDVKVGNGPAAKPGKTVMVYYEGRLKQNNKMFDNCLKGPGFKFRLGAKEVISGWDVGITGMKVGGKRKIVCPPAMAYGAKGSPPVIPPNSTLVFEVELKNVK